MTKIDLLPYLKCDDLQMYALQYNIAGHSGTQTIQTQVDGKLFYHVKDHEWERMYFDSHYIYREADTSEAPDRYYVQTKDGMPGCDWIRRFMAVGEEYHAEPFIKHYWQATGQLRLEGQCSNVQKIVALHNSYTFKSGITLPDVIELVWMVGGQPEEYYYYAKGFGLVAWKQAKHGWESYICEIISGRPKLEREVVEWLPANPTVLYRKPNVNAGAPCLMRAVRDVNVRTGPGTNHDVIWRLNRGAIIYVNRVEAVAPGNAWAEFASGMWCAIEYRGVAYLELADGDPAVVAGPFRLHKPVSCPIRVTQEFGKNPAFYARWKLPGHEGIDFATPLGSKILACHDGTVYRVHTNPDNNNYGIHVRIRHITPDGQEFKTIYAHLKSAAVKVGDVVKRGQVVGDPDNTGNSFGRHLHLTVKLKGATAAGLTNYPSDIIDPTEWLGL